MNRTFNRALAWAIAIAALALLAAYISPAVAQDKPATVSELQANTPCGAEAVGLNRSTSMPVRYQREGLHVGADGVWTECTMPRAPAAKPLQAGCVTDQAITWQSAGNTCTHTGAAQIAHGARQVIQPDPGSTDGVLLLSCRNGVITRQLAACSPATECVGSYRGTDDGGASWWAWSGRLREGSTAQASDGAGNSRLIRCEGGKLRLQ